MIIKSPALITLLVVAFAAAAASIIFLTNLGSPSFAPIVDFLIWRPVAIDTGIVWEQPNLAQEAPLRFIADKANYAVKVIDAKSNTELMLIYIAAGEVFTTKLPVGRYMFKAINGPIWYGAKRLFGGETHPIFLEQQSNGPFPLYDYITRKPCVAAPPTVFDFTKSSGCSFKMLQGAPLYFQPKTPARYF